MTAVKISVIICTYNRAASLQRTLETCAALVVPKDTRWELLVVDNNSTDATRRVCDTFENRLPIRCLFEFRQGKSHALNRGVAEAKGGLLLFTDDDVDLEPGWLDAYANTVLRYPQASFLGGKVLPRWERPPPKWFVDNQDCLLTNVHVDKGETEGPLSNFKREDDPPFFTGANWAVRRSVLASGLNYRTDLGPADSQADGLAVGPGEEIDLQERLLQTGHVGIYVPRAVVFHRQKPEQQTERHLRRYYIGTGIATVRLLKGPRTGIHWFGAPRSCWRVLILSSLTYGLTRLWAPSRTWLAAEVRMACAWGYIYELRRSRRHRVETDCLAGPNIDT